MFWGWFSKAKVIGRGGNKEQISRLGGEGTGTGTQQHNKQTGSGKLRRILIQGECHLSITFSYLKTEMFSH